MASGWHGIRLSVASDPQYLAPLRAVVGETSALLGFSEEEAMEVMLAVQEGCANVIRHCYKDRHDERIDVEIRIDGGELTVKIDDYGRFVDPGTIRGRDLEDVRPGGLGVHFMRKVMDEVTYVRNPWGGTTLTMVRRPRGTAPGHRREDAGPGAGDGEG